MRIMYLLHKVVNQSTNISNLPCLAQGGSSKPLAEVTGEQGRQRLNTQINQNENVCKKVQWGKGRGTGASCSQGPCTACTTVIAQ
jgi:hypothetical protein